MMSDKMEDPEMMLQSRGSAPVPGMMETVVEIKANEEQGEERVSMIPRRGEVAVGIKTIIDNLRSKDEDCARARRVMIAGRGRTKRKREAGKLILSRIEDLFGNQVGGKQEKRKANGDQECSNERNVKTARK